MQAKNPHTGLTKKQEAFCEAFVRLGDKSAAYREVYSTKNHTDKSVNENACRLSNVVKVKSRIEELQKSVAEIAKEKFNIDTETILRHLDILRNARIDEYVEYIEYEVPTIVTTGTGKGRVTTTTYEKKTELRFKPFNKLTEQQLMCIESIKQTRFGVELKLHGKEWTIEKINKHIGFYEKDNEQKNKILTPEDREERIRKLEQKALANGN